MLGAFQFTFDGIPWPPQFQVQLSGLYAIFSFDFFAIFSLSPFFQGWDCKLGSLGFATSFNITMYILPVSVLIIGAAILISSLHMRFGCLRRVCGAPPLHLTSVIARGLKVLITIVFLIYPSICAKVAHNHFSHISIACFIHLP